MDVACLLKSYLRTLPEPLLTYTLHDAYLDAVNLERGADKLRALRLIGTLLPKENRAVLKMVLGLFGEIVDGCNDEDGGSKMTSQSLAVVVGLNMFRQRPTTAAAAAAHSRQTSASSDGAGPAVVGPGHYHGAYGSGGAYGGAGGATGGSDHENATNAGNTKQTKKKKKPLLHRLLGRSNKKTAASESAPSYSTAAEAAAAAAAALRSGAVVLDDTMTPVACTVVELLIDLHEHIFTIPADLRDDMLQHYNSVSPARTSAILWGLITAARVLAPRRLAAANSNASRNGGGLDQPHGKHVGGGGGNDGGRGGGGQAITWIDGAKPTPTAAAIAATAAAATVVQALPVAGAHGHRRSKLTTRRHVTTHPSSSSFSAAQPSPLSAEGHRVDSSCAPNRYGDGAVAVHRRGASNSAYAGAENYTPANLKLLQLQHQIHVQTFTNGTGRDAEHGQHHQHHQHCQEQQQPHQHQHQHQHQEHQHQHQEHQQPHQQPHHHPHPHQHQHTQDGLRYTDTTIESAAARGHGHGHGRNQVHNHAHRHARAPSPSAIETVYREHQWRARADGMVAVGAAALDQSSMVLSAGAGASVYDPFINDDGRELGTPV